MVKFFTSAEAQQTAMEMQGMVPASNTVELTDTAKDKYPLLAEFLNLATTEGEKALGYSTGYDVRQPARRYEPAAPAARFR